MPPDPDPKHGEFAHDPEGGEDVPVEDWMPVPVSDSAEYLDRPDPIYLEDDQENPS